MWGVLGVMWACAKLPFGAQLAIGRGLGRLMHALLRSRRRVAARNLAVCFPGLDDDARRALVRRHFEALGISFIEMGLAWFASDETLRRLVRVDGREHLLAAARDGRGVLLISAHFTPLELCFAVLRYEWPGIGGMYHPQRNALIDTMIRRGRSRFLAEQISRDDVRTLVRVLRRGGTVAYLPDQTYVGNQSRLMPFFGEPALTNIAAPKLAELGRAVIVPYLFRRLPGTEGYVVTIHPPLPGVPSGDAQADTTKWVAALEAQIRLAPEQYLWIYKKFKGRPPPLPDLYA